MTTRMLDFFLNPQRLYSSKVWLVYIGICTLFWFIFTQSGLLERLVFRLLPSYLNETLKERWRIALGGNAHRPETTTINKNDTPLMLNDAKLLYDFMSRSASLLHSWIALILYITITQYDKAVIQNKEEGISSVWVYTGPVVIGYFLWDFMVIVHNFSYTWRCLQWLLHALICVLAFLLPYFSPYFPMHYYHAAFLSMEISTPFFSLRYFYSMGLMLLRKTNHSNAHYISKTQHHVNILSFLFVVSFFFSRIILTPYYVFFPLLNFFFYSSHFYSSITRYLYMLSITAFLILNLIWMVEILSEVFKVRKIHRL